MEMNKEIREMILKNMLARTVTKAGGRILEFKYGSAVIMGKLMAEKCYFWVKGDDSTYELKGKRFFTVSGSEIRKEDTPLPKGNAGAVAPLLKVAPVPEVKKVIKDVPSELVEQLAYDGTKEYVHADLYCNKVVCKCGNVRWVKNCDLFQVKFCKPCTIIERRQKNKERRATK